MPLPPTPSPADPPRAGTLPSDTAPTFASWADSVLFHLSLEEKAGQLLMPWMLGDFAPEGSASQERIEEMIENQKIGGVIVSVGSPTEVAVKLNNLQNDSDLPLLVAADLERGAGFRFRGAVFLPGPISLGGATEFPSLMAVGATGSEELAENMGRVTGIESLALGVHVPFAPVLDVNNNPENPIINVRSFGEDPGAVARLGTAFVRGLQDSGAIATGKHFPGHGDTGTDSHLDLPIIDVSRERMDSVELPPFQAAIDGGIGGIMTAHIALPPSREGMVIHPHSLLRSSQVSFEKRWVLGPHFHPMLWICMPSTGCILGKKLRCGPWRLEPISSSCHRAPKRRWRES